MFICVMHLSMSGPTLSLMYRGIWQLRYQWPMHIGGRYLVKFLIIFTLLISPPADIGLSTHVYKYEV